ncbi:MAG: carbohydrate ABC transporter permease [Spirochaetaceae bacterium]|nr:carbohydrate ABC transporter permease [Spirochaetaceae bacterium]
MAEIRAKDTRTILLKILLYIIMTVFVVLAVYPILWLILQSFKTSQDYLRMNKLALPTNWYTGNYPFVWMAGHFERLIPNSILYTAVSVICIILFGFMAGFAFARIPSRATRFLYGSFIIGILLSIQSLMIPLFLLINFVGLYNTRLGVVIPYIGIGLSIGVYLGTAYMRGIPQELVDIARIDGAGYLKIFFLVILPLSAPAAVTVALLTGFSVMYGGLWNEYIFVDIITQSNRLKSLAVGITWFSPYWIASYYGRHFAALVIGLVPSALFYFVFRKQITKGVIGGSFSG